MKINQKIFNYIIIFSITLYIVIFIIGSSLINPTGYITGDSANSFADGTDFVVMITGLKDLGTGASYNATSNTLEIA